jgi:pyroglutamyl-peptidase
VSLSVLLTGYEPWNDFKVNSSWEAAKALHGQWIAGASITSRILPVSYTGMPAALEEAIEEVQPDLCIGLGMEPRGSRIRLERIALNLADAPDYADNDGNAPEGRPLIADASAPLAYHARLPIRHIESVLTEAAIPVMTSLSAGAFLCNAAFYYTMHISSRPPRSFWGGFIHVPPLPGTPAAPDPEHGMPLEQIVEAVRLAIQTVFETY